MPQSIMGETPKIRGTFLGVPIIRIGPSFLETTLSLWRLNGMDPFRNRCAIPSNHHSNPWIKV